MENYLLHGDPVGMVLHEGMQLLTDPNTRLALGIVLSGLAGGGTLKLLSFWVKRHGTTNSEPNSEAPSENPQEI